MGFHLEFGQMKSFKLCESQINLQHEICVSRRTFTSDRIQVNSCHMSLATFGF
jgi:hypothetical protein